MKAIFKVLACAAALSFFVACGPSVSGDPQKDAKTYLELAKEDPKAAQEFAKEVEAEYGKDAEKAAEFLQAIGGEIANEMGVELE